MGKIFELIADKALYKLADYYTECHVCGKENIDLYSYQGKVTLEDRTIDDDIYAVCTNCILTKPLKHICDFEYIETINSYLENSDLTTPEKEAIKNNLIKKYQQTPDIPIWMQYQDTPLCCNDITEFTGYPANSEELYDIVENNIYWEKGIKEKRELCNFQKYGNPESFRDIAVFKCKHCGKQYFTFQFT